MGSEERQRIAYLPPKSSGVPQGTPDVRRKRRESGGKKIVSYEII
jgi:hypothetical protein